MEGLISTHSAPTLRRGPLSPAGLTLERNILQQISQELEVVESGLGFGSLAWRACPDLLQALSWIPSAAQTGCGVTHL